MAVGRYGAALIALLGVGLCAALFSSDASSVDVPLRVIQKVHNAFATPTGGPNP